MNSILKETAKASDMSYVEWLIPKWYSFRPTTKNDEVIAEKKLFSNTGVTQCACGVFGTPKL